MQVSLAICTKLSENVPLVNGACLDNKLKKAVISTFLMKISSSYTTQVSLTFKVVGALLAYRFRSVSKICSRLYNVLAQNFTGSPQNG
jgi:hypothetical protein